MTNRTWPFDGDRKAAVPGPDEASGLVYRYFQAVSAGSLGPSFYTNDAVLHYSGRHALSGDYEGYASMSRMFESSASKFPGALVLRHRQVLAGGPYGAALIDASAEDATRRQVSWLRVVVFRFTGDLIDEQWLFDFDPQAIGEVLK